MNEIKNIKGFQSIFSKLIIVFSLVLLNVLFLSPKTNAVAPAPQTPKDIVLGMFSNMVNIKSLSYSGDLKMELESEVQSNPFGLMLNQPNAPTKIEKSKFFMTFSGSSDVKNPINPKIQFSFKVKTDALTGKESVFGFEFRTINNIAYVKLNSAVNLGFFDLSSLKNKWIKIDPKAMADRFGKNTTNNTTVTSVKKPELSLDQVEKMKSLVTKYDIFKVTDVLPEQSMGGAPSYHYKFLFDQEEYKKFLIEAETIVKNAPLTILELQDIEDQIKRNGVVSGEIWIGKKDLLPRKISIDTVVSRTPSSPYSGKVNINISLKNINKSVKVTVPSKSEPFDKFLENMFGGFSR